MICGCWLLVSAFAQTSSLFTTTNKTTSLIHPFPIRYVDRGTKDVLVEQVRKADTVLPLKAASQNFHETNLSVVTSEGSLCYDVHPTAWVWQFPLQTGASVACYDHWILDNPVVISVADDRNCVFCGKLIGINFMGDVIYYQLRLENLSTIDYDIGLLKFCIRDKKRAGERRYRKKNRHHCISQAIPL
jgi:hypothetical protein